MNNYMSIKTTNGLPFEKNGFLIWMSGMTGGTLPPSGQSEYTVPGYDSTAITPFVTLSESPVPEPASLAIFGVAGAGLLIRRRT